MADAGRHINNIDDRNQKAGYGRQTLQGYSRGDVQTYIEFHATRLFLSQTRFASLF